MQTGPSRASGIDVLGQRILFVAALSVVVLAAFVPAAIAAGAAFLAAAWIVGIPAAIALAVASVLVVLSVEIGMGVWWLGQRFERFDLSAELKP
jgi:ABC-2 type transport system permease protein